MTFKLILVIANNMKQSVAVDDMDETSLFQVPLSQKNTKTSSEL
ncbi:hypothetical protein [Polaribacter septentrionalilitoris]|nr:hypothetical protein [Polaribacter septentrionalilitoris]